LVVHKHVSFYYSNRFEKLGHRIHWNNQFIGQIGQIQVRGACA
jgi:hypothetical protein